MPATSAAGVGLANPADVLAAATSGGAFLFLGVPPGTAFTIDGHAFVAGPNFAGLKMVPPGPHCIAYAAGGAGASAPGPVTCFWAWVDVAGGGRGGSGADPPSHRRQTVIIRRWDPATELLVPTGDEEEDGRYAAGVARFDFDARLAPYALRAWAAWRALAGHIDGTTLARLAPAGVPGGNASVVAEADPGGVGGLAGGEVGGGARRAAEKIRPVHKPGGRGGGRVHTVHSPSREACERPPGRI